MLFAVLYFMQGIVEPTDGLMSQPVRSLLRGWGQHPQEITTFVAWLSLPWTLKVFVGFLIDFVPLWGSRRRSYLLLTTAWCAIGMFTLYVFPPSNQLRHPMLLWLMGINMAISSSDVATDALMVEVGQPRGLTGRLQSIQWTAMCAAGILGGYLGGYLSGPGLAGRGFLYCALVSLGAFAGVGWLLRREPPAVDQPLNFRAATATLFQAVRSPPMLSVAGYLIFCNFFMSSQALLQVHMTEYCKLSNLFYGKCLTYVSLASMLASISYGLYCHRLSVRTVAHLGIGLGALSTLCNFGITDAKSAVIISWLSGFLYQTANLAQLDLTARACPSAIAGTGFAFFMALSNLSGTIAVWLGGYLYEKWLPMYGAAWAYRNVNYLGAAINAAAWLTMPWLQRSGILGPSRGAEIVVTAPKVDEPAAAATILPAPVE